MNRLLSRLDKWASLIGVLILALAVRLMGIVSRPIWYDEAIAILLAEKGPSALLVGTLSQDASGTAANVHPLAYHTALWGWMRVFGEGLPSVRMLSVLFGIGTVALAYLLMRAMFNPRLALLGAMGVALSPFLVHYSQEIRMYSLLALALVAATYAFWQGLHSNQLRWWVIFSFCAALAQYTQSLAAFYLVPLALTPLFLRRWEKVKLTFLAGIGAVVLYLPWLMNVPAQYANIENAYWVARPTLTKTFTLLMVYATNLPVKDGWLPLSLFVSLLVMTLASYQTYLAFRKRLSEARRGLWLAYLTFAPPALVFLVSQWRPVYVERAFVASGSMFWLWLAWALTATGLPRLLKTVTLILLMAGITLGLVSHVTYSGPPYGPFKELDNFLTSRIEAGDVIVHSNKMSFMPAVYFNRTLKQQFIGDPQGGVDDTLAPATQQVLGIEETPSLEIATSGAKRVWFITSKNGLDLQADLDWLDNHSRLVSKETWGPILLYLYTQQGK